MTVDRPQLECPPETEGADHPEGGVEPKSPSHSHLRDRGNGPPSHPVVQEALTELGQYLSDSLPPLMVADSLTVLTRVPSHQVAAELAAWATAQQGAGGLPITDYYFHGLRKVQLIGEFGLVPASLFEPFFSKLKSTMLEGAPPSDRERLAADLARLAEGRSVAVEKVTVLHRPADADGDSGEAQDPEGAEGRTEAAAARPPGLRLTLPAGFELHPQALRRLEMLLQRLGPLAPATTPERRSRVTAEAFATVAAGASSPHEMDAQLAEFSSAGLAYGTYELFRALGENLPGWWAPGLGTADGTDPGLAAMERLVTLAEDRVEASRRFREMIENAIEQFNAGALGRAVRMFDLALKMIERGEVLAESVESLRERGHQALDPDCVAALVQQDNPQGFPRVILRFFPALSPERLLDELQREPRRERRQTLLALIESHGDDGREAVFDRLVHRPDEMSQVYLFRNLVYLLRQIPRTVNTTWPQEHEIARVIRFLVPERPLLLVKEIVAYLSAAHHPVASQSLRAFLERLEAIARSPETPQEERAHIRFRLDATCRALAESDEPRCWEALLEHALRPETEPDDALRRLRGLGRRDLSGGPGLVKRLVDIAHEEVEKGPDPADGSRSGVRLVGCLCALASTRTPQVRALLESVAGRLPGEDAGREATDQLRAMEGTPTPGTVPEGGLMGDLGLFALPALLQSLADLRCTGTVTFLGGDEEVVGQVMLEEGLVVDGRVSELTGPRAVWQLMERPLAVRFSFVPHGGTLPPDVEEPQEVTALLLEGMKRSDELRVFEALVPGDACLEARVEGCPPVPHEDDEGLTRGLWTALVGGRTVSECEEALAVDAFRVWRAAASWVETGALEPVTEVA